MSDTNKAVNPLHPLRQGDGADPQLTLAQRLGKSIAKPINYLRWYFFQRKEANATRELPVGRYAFDEETGNTAAVNAPIPTGEKSPPVWELGKPETWLHGVHPEDIKLRDVDPLLAGNMTVGIGEDPQTGEAVTAIQFRGNESVIKMPPPEFFGLTQQQVDYAREGKYESRNRNSRGTLNTDPKVVPVSMAVSAVKRAPAETQDQAATLIKVLEVVTGKSAEEAIAEQRLAEARARNEELEDDAGSTADIATTAIREAVLGLEAVEDDREQNGTIAKFDPTVEE